MQSQVTTVAIFFFFFFFLNVSEWTVQGQSLPPASYDGFVYQNRRGGPDSILIEAFFDPLCPDSRDAWPPLKQALLNYGSRVSVVVHLLPLPYHDNAFAASRALHIVNGLSTSFTFPLLEQFFAHQERFYNDPTLNFSRHAVVKEIVDFVTAKVGNSYRMAIESGFNDRKTDLKTRISFKYSTSRGVFATPTFYVNGFVLPDAGSALDYNRWRKIINPLIETKGGPRKDGPHFFL